MESATDKDLGILQLKSHSLHLENRSHRLELLYDVVGQTMTLLLAP